MFRRFLRRPTRPLTADRPVRPRWADTDKVLALRLTLEALEDRTAPAVFSVTTTADAGVGSLRQAILAANAAPGADVIDFSPLTGPVTITPTSSLPAITDAVTVDGWTVGGFAGKPLVELNGASAGGGVNGLTITGPNVTVRGLVVNRFGGNGIQVSGSTATGAVIAGNYIGTNTAGTAKAGNGFWGIGVVNAANVTVGGSAAVDRNLISGNTQGGVYAYGKTTKNLVVRGNLVGTDVTGSAALGNTFSGVFLGVGDGFGLPTAGPASGATIADNVISGNAENGVWIKGAGADGNTITGNYIGTNATGTAAIPNAFNGVSVESGPTNTRIGTNGDGVNDAAERNLISGNTGAGVFIDGVNNVVAGNYIGVDSTGAVRLGNTGAGVRVQGSGNRIGTDGSNDAFNANERNVISGNGRSNIENNFSPNTVIAGNYIGTNAAGTASVGNGNGWPGIYVWWVSSTNVRIGTNADGVADTEERNVISGNSWAGIVTGAAAGDRITGLVIAGNYMGTNAAGTSAVPNGNGVALYDATAVRVGTNGDGVNDAAERNVISGNTDNGVVVQGTNIAGTVIAGNYIGIDATGTFAVANTGNAGVLVTNGAVDTRIGTDGSNDAFNANERNVLSGNTQEGIQVESSGTVRTVIAGNYVGTNAAGTAAVSNGASGIIVTGSGGNTIGGTSSVSRNILSGNGYGVFVTGTDAKANTILGNWIGVNASGTAALPNYYGVLIGNGANGTTVGGTAAGAGNLVSGNTVDGIGIYGSSTNTVVQGNRIGTTPDGLAALPNAKGIVIDSGASNTVIGGSLVGSRNIISGNSQIGIQIRGSGTTGNLILGNYIGTTADGVAALPNLGPGIVVEAGSTGSRVGGTSVGETNTIAFSTGPGVQIDGPATSKNTVSRNSIFANVGGSVLVTNGANGGAVPVALTAALAGASTRLFGTLTGVANQAYRLDVYASAAGQAETRTFLTGTTVTVPAGSVLSLDIVLPISTTPAGGFTALATRLDTGDSSGLSNVVPAKLVLLDGVPTGAVLEGTPITLATRAGDPGPGQTVAYEWRVTRNGLPYDSGAEATFSFTPADVGDFAVTLTVRTSTGLVDTVGPVAIRVDNRPPAVEFVAQPTAGVVGVPVTVAVRVPDEGTSDVFTYEWRVNGTVVTPTAADPRVLTFTPTANGVYTVTVTVSDEDGGATTRGTTVLATGGRPAATIEVPSVANEGDVVSARAAVADLLAQDDLRFAWQVLKNGVPFAAAGGRAVPNIEFTPDDDGVYEVRLIVTTAGGTAYPAPARTVVVRNVAPVPAVGVDGDGDGVADPGPRSLAAGRTVTLLASAADRGTADRPVFNWAVRDAASGLVVRRGLGSTLAFTPPAAGVYVAELTARDGGGGVGTVSLPLEATAGDLDVSIRGPGGPTPEGSPVNLTAVGVPAGTPVRYEWEVTRDGERVSRGSADRFTFTPPDNGSFTVRLRVTDADGRAGEATLELAAVNVPATVSLAAPAGLVREGSPVVLTAAFVDPAADDVLTFRWFVNGVPVPGAAGPTLTFTPPDDGAYTVRVLVADDDTPADQAASAEAVVTAVNVAPTAEVRPATDPTGASVVPPEVAAYPLRFTAAVTDPGADTFTYAWAVSRIDPVTGEPVDYVFGTDPLSDPTRPAFGYAPVGDGVYRVRLTVTDDDGGVSVGDVRVVTGTDGPDTIVIRPADLPPGATAVYVFGLGGADRIDASGVTFPVVIDAGAGDDTVLGGGGDDVIFGGPGTDSLSGGDGADTLATQHGDDTVAGGDGDDVYLIVPGSDAVLSETGTGGTDTVNFAYADRGVTFDLSRPGVQQTVDLAGNHMLFTGSFEAVVGSRFVDTLKATAGASLFGGAGDDDLTAGPGAAGASLTGGDGADQLRAAAEQVGLFGGSGDDWLVADAGAANVTVFGGDGADAVDLRGGDLVTVFGGDGADRVVVTGGSQVTVYGGGGDDDLGVYGGADVLVFGGAEPTEAGANGRALGGSGRDQIAVIGGTNVTVFGGDGDDELEAGGGADIALFGGAGDDSLSVSTAASWVTVFGGDGGDAIEVSAGAQVTVFGGTGDDLVGVTGGTAVTVFGGTGDDRVDVTGGAGVQVSGDAGADTVRLATPGGPAIAFGGDGADAVTVADGAAVTVFGGDGADRLEVLDGTGVTVFGGAGDDAVTVTGGTAVTVFGGSGDDSVDVSAGTTVTVFGGDGADAVGVTGGTAVTVFGGDGDDAVTAVPVADTQVTVFGGDGSDALTVGGAGETAVLGEGGGDRLTVRGGSLVTVFGGDGADVVDVTGGTAVTVFGGDGDDVVRLDAAATGVTVYGEAGADAVDVVNGTQVTVFGGTGDDRLTVEGGSHITVFGGEGQDTLRVTGGSQVTAVGGSGNDEFHVLDGSQVTVFGGDGADQIAVAGGSLVTVFGGDGADLVGVTGGTAVTVFGGSGDDAITVAGGAGVAVLGGDGADTLRHTAGTGVTVFGEAGNDTLTTATDGGELVGGDGADVLTAEAGTGTGASLYGGAGNDTLTAAAGGRLGLFGGAGDDILLLTAAVGTDVTVFGGAGADTVTVAGGRRVSVYGEDGADALTAADADGGQITVFGGVGDDLVRVDAGGQVTVFGGVGNDDLRAESTGGQITVFGGAGDDTLSATAGTAVRLLGDRGNDALGVFGVSNALAFGGAGNDTLTGSGGVDIELYGDDGDDTYRVLAAATATRVRLKETRTPGETAADKEAGTDHVDRPSQGAETIDLSGMFAVSFDLSVLGSDLDPLAGWQTVGDSTGRAAVVVLQGAFENVTGTPGPDRLVGGPGANRLVGNGGDDTLVGGAGDDTLEGGAGDDTLDGGAGNDTYRFAGTELGTDTVVEADDADADALDFSGLTAGGVSIDLSAVGPQAEPGVTVVLPSGSAVENLTGTRFADRLTGNARPNVIDGGPGNDTLVGGAGPDTYVFAGPDTGADALTEDPADPAADTLDFSQLGGGIDANLRTGVIVGRGGLPAAVILSDPTAVENVIGTSFPDVLVGNVAANALTGGGGRDRIDGGAGGDTLRGGSGQTIVLDFDSAADPWEWAYTPDQRAAITARVRADFAPFGFAVTTATPATGPYLRVAFNDGPAGGTASQIDFRNLGLAGRATVNADELRPQLAAALAAAGQPVPTTDAEWAPLVVNLSATIAVHEAGHYFGLRHGDAYGPVGAGVNTPELAARYRPALPPDSARGVDTRFHLMASPESLGVSLLDSAADPYFGVREAIKLAFAGTGVTAREQAADAYAHNSFATAEPLGRLPGLAVPNTLRKTEGPFAPGDSLAVAAVAVSGTIVRSPNGPSEDDYYSFAAIAGERWHFEVNSADLARVANPVDSVLRVYDAAGTLLVEVDDEFETPDAVILDWVAPADGAYYVVVDTYTPDGVTDFDTGDYEVFAYRVGVGPALGVGDTLITGAGADDVVTGPGADTVVLSAGTTARVEVTGDGRPTVVNPTGATYHAVDANGNPVGVTVRTTDTPPALAPVELPAAVAEGQTVTLALAGSDPDTGERLSYSVEALPGFAFPPALAVDESTGVVRWVPPDNGTFGFRLVVTDAVGRTAIRDVTAAVANRPPTAAVNGPAAADQGDVVRFTATAADPGPSDALTYAWAVDGQPAGTGPELASAPARPGVHTVTLTITDKDGASTVTTRTLTVANRPPVPRIDPPAAAAEGDPLTVTGGAADPGDPTAPLTLRWTARLDGRVVAEGGGPAFTFTPGASGEYELLLIATDPDGGSTTAIQTVRVANRPPTIVPLSTTTTASEGQPVTLPAPPTDVPADLPLTVEWTAVAVDGAVYTATGPTFVPPDGGEYQLRVRVTDKAGATAESTGLLTVTDAAPAGTFGPLDPAVEGTPFRVGFSDLVNSPADLTAGLRYSFDLNGDGVYEIVDVSTPSVSLTVTRSGTVRVGGRVTDRDGLFRDYAVNIPVVANAPPTVSDVTDQTVAFNGSTGPLTFTVGDDHTPTTALVVTASSSNPTLVPAAGIVLGGSGAARTVTVTPAAGQFGSATITLTVADAGGRTATDTFVVTVPNTAPTVSDIADRSTSSGGAVGPIEFLVGDVETPAGLLVVTAASSNLTLVPLSAIKLGGSGSNRTIRVTPTPGLSGTAVVTVTVTDAGGLAATDTFTLSVQGVPAVTGFDVQRGQAQRSFVRYIDVTLDSPAHAQALVQSDRVRLIRRDLSGNNPAVVPAGSLSVSGSVLAFDFGANGIGGNRNSNAGDGYYTLELDLDGNGSYETARSFYRLLGDTNGDRAVDAADVAAIERAISQNLYVVDLDLNGDGYVNLTDRLLSLRAQGRFLAPDLWPDD